MANPFDVFDKPREPQGTNPFDVFDKPKPQAAYTAWEEEGAPASRRYIAGGIPQEKQLAYLKTLDPNATAFGDGNYLYREPDTGKVTLYNKESWLPTWGDIASAAPEISEMVGGAGAAVAAAPGALASALPTAGASLLTIPAAYGLGAAGAKEAENLIATNLLGRPDDRSTGERLGDAASTAAWNAAFEMAGPVVGKLWTGAKEGVKSILPGGQKAIEEAAVKKLASQAERPLWQLQDDLNSFGEGQKYLNTGLERGTGALIDAPNLSAAERAFVREQESTLDALRRDRTAQLSTAYDRVAPSGDALAPQRMAAQREAALKAALDAERAAREEALAAARRRGDEAVTAARQTADQTLASAAERAARTTDSAAARIAEERAALAARQADETDAARGNVASLLTPGRSAAEASAEAAARALGEREVRRETVQGLYSLPDKAALVDTTPLRETVEAMMRDRNALVGAARKKKYFPLDFIRAWEGTGLLNRSAPAGALEAERSTIGQAIREAEKGGNNILRARLLQLRSALDNAVGSVPEFKEPIARAREFTAKEFKDPYLNGVSKMVFSPANQGGLKVAPEKMLGYFIRPDLQGGVTNAAKLLSALPSTAGANGERLVEPEALRAVHDFVLDNLRKAVVRDGTKVDGNALNRWIADHQGTIRAIPGLQEKLGSAQAAVASFDSMAARHAEEIAVMNAGAKETTSFAKQEAEAILDEAKASGKQSMEEAKAWAKELEAIASDKTLLEEATRNLDAFQKSAFGRKLDADPNEYANQFLTSTEWRKELAFAKQVIGDDKAALEGFKRVVFDRAWKDLQGFLLEGGNTAYERMLARVRPRLRALFGPETARHFDLIATDVMLNRASFIGPRKSVHETIQQGDPRSLVMKFFRRGGGTLSARAIGAIIASSTGAVVGGVPGFFLGTAGAGLSSGYETAMNRYLRHIDDLYKEIVLDPQKARSLVDQVMTRRNAPSKFRDFMQAYNRAMLPGSIPMTYDPYSDTLAELLRPALLRRGAAATSETE